MAPIDEWLNVWLSATDLAKDGEYRSPGPLHVYAMNAFGDGAPVSVAEAPDGSEQLQRAATPRPRGRSSRFSLALIAGGDYPKTPKRTPSKEDLFEAYAWSIATEERIKESPVWLKYSPEQVLAAYRRADEIRRENEAR